MGAFHLATVKEIFVRHTELDLTNCLWEESPATSARSEDKVAAVEVGGPLLRSFNEKSSWTSCAQQSLSSLSMALSGPAYLSGSEWKLSVPVLYPLKAFLVCFYKLHLFCQVIFP